MPWCPECDRFLSPPAVRVDGSCPRCGSAVDPGRARSAAPPSGPAPGEPGPSESTESTDAASDDLGPIPWHLKLLAGAVALYLGYRALQGVEWVLHRF